MTLAFESAQQLANKVANKEISALELTEYFISRIEKFDGPLNAVVVKDFERARADAKKADQHQAAGNPLGPLHGVPMTIKESYNIEGLPTHWGIEPLKNNIAAEDAYYVQKMKQAGAVFLGKTNVPVNLGDFQSFNPVYGTTNNPWDVTRTPGGSSGGSAAALAAGFCGLEAGSDIGGSIRNPAHFCGVFGHKPTYGVVPWQGHSLPGMTKMADIAVVGPLARTADDLRLSMDLVAGAEPNKAPGWQLTLPKPNKKSLKDYKVAIWIDESEFPVSQEVRERVQMVTDTLASEGATLSDTARPGIDVNSAYETYLHLLQGALSASIPEPEFSEMKQAPLADMPASEAKTMLAGATQDHRSWAALDGQREGFRNAWRSFFSEWDIVVCPIMPTSAFVHDQTEMLERTIAVDNQTIPYLRQIFWAGLTGVSYLPSTVFPTGPSREGLPIGLQAVGAEFMDYQCIDFAAHLEKIIGGFTAPTGFDD